MLIRIDWDQEKEEWVATIPSCDKAFFCYRAPTMDEAIGGVIRSNREVLKISMYGVEQNGKPWWSANAPESTKKKALALQEEQA